MPPNGLAHNLQTSPARADRETTVYARWHEPPSATRRDAEGGGGGRSQLVQLSVRFRGLLYGVREFGLLAWRQRTGIDSLEFGVSIQSHWPPVEPPVIESAGKFDPNN